MKICGVDEAGRGPLAGPVVVAAVIMTEGIKINGIRDSKKLKPAKREELFKMIVDSAIDYKIEIVDNNVIDEINILKATMLGVERCLTKLSLTDVKVLIDGSYFKLADGREKNYNYETVIKGDDIIYQISCASILAKVTRDRLMAEYENLYPEYGFASHKGYGTKMHIERLLEYGMCEIHRKTFCRKILERNELNR